MKFGRKLQTEVPPLYRNYALNYQELKEQIFYQDEVTVVQAVSREVVSENLRFQELLERELLKVNRFARLEIESIDKLKSAPVPAVARRLVELEKFVRLNQTGFRKICKKFDKLRKTNLQFWFMSRVARSEFATIDFHARLAKRLNSRPAASPPLSEKAKPRCFLVPSDEVFALMTFLATSEPSRLIQDPQRRQLIIYECGKIAAERQSDKMTVVTFGNRDPILREVMENETFETLNLGRSQGTVSFTRTTLVLADTAELRFDEDFTFEPETFDFFDYGVLRVFGGNDDIIEDVLTHAGVSEVGEIIGNLAEFFNRPKKSRTVSPAESAEAPLVAGEKEEPGKIRKALVRVEPKTFFANERVLLDWIHVALVLSGVAALRGGAAAVWLAAASVLVVGVGLRNFLRRKQLLLGKATSGYFSLVQPVILGLAIAVLVASRYFY
jgi:hypothetical protein